MAAILPGGLSRIDARLLNVPGGLRRRIGARPPNIIPRRPTLSPWAPNFDPRAPNLNAVPPDIGLRLTTIDTEAPLRSIDTSDARNLDTFVVIIVLVILWATSFGLPVYLCYVLCTEGLWATIEVVRTISGATASVVVAGLVAVAVWSIFREPLEELLGLWHGNSREGVELLALRYRYLWEGSGELLTLWYGYMTEAFIRLRRSIVSDSIVSNIENPGQIPHRPCSLDGSSSDSLPGGSSDGYPSLPTSPPESPPRVPRPDIRNQNTGSSATQLPISPSPDGNAPNEQSQHTVTPDILPPPYLDALSRNQSSLNGSNGQSQHTLASGVPPPSYYYDLHRDRSSLNDSNGKDQHTVGLPRPSNVSRPGSFGRYVRPGVEDADDADNITMSGGAGQGSKSPDVPRLRRFVQRPHSPTRVDGILDRYPDDPLTSAFDPRATSFSSTQARNSRTGTADSRSARPLLSSSDPSWLSSPESIRKHYLQTRLPNIGGSETSNHAPLFETRDVWLLRKSREWKERQGNNERSRPRELEERKRNNERSGTREARPWQPSVQDIWPDSRPEVPRDEEYERRRKKKTDGVYYRKFL